MPTPPDVSPEIVTLLTGHGHFNTHLHRVGKMESAACPYCPTAPDDDPLHRLLDCPVYEPARVHLQAMVEDWPIQLPDLATLMMKEAVIAGALSWFAVPPPQPDHPRAPP